MPGIRRRRQGRDPFLVGTARGNQRHLPPHGTGSDRRTHRDADLTGSSCYRMPRQATLPSSLPSRECWRELIAAKYRKTLRQDRLGASFQGGCHHAPYSRSPPVPPLHAATRPSGGRRRSRGPVRPSRGHDAGTRRSAHARHRKAGLQPLQARRLRDHHGLRRRRRDGRSPSHLRAGPDGGSGRGAGGGEPPAGQAHGNRLHAGDRQHGQGTRRLRHRQRRRPPAGRGKLRRRPQGRRLPAGTGRHGRHHPHASRPYRRHHGKTARRSSPMRAT